MAGAAGVALGLQCTLLSTTETVKALLLVELQLRSLCPSPAARRLRQKEAHMVHHLEVVSGPLPALRSLLESRHHHTT